MTLKMLIDTSVWIDLAQGPRSLPLLDAIVALAKAGEISFILPQIVVDEFERNRDRLIESNRASLSSHFKRVRAAIMQFGTGEGKEIALNQINEIDHRIATGVEAVNEAMQLIDEVFAMTAAIPTAENIKSRAADRAIGKVAPFHRSINGIGDAIIIETYIDALKDRTDAEDIYAFITHNVQDFSQKGADTRLPHLDLASLFDGVGSRYETNLGILLNEVASDLVEESAFDRNYTHEARGLSEILETEHKFMRQIWYNRHWNLRIAIERGKHKVVSEEVWEKASPKKRQRLTVDTIWDGALAAAKRAEDELGLENIGPWNDFEWGMLNGKLSALRWILGDEWDMLDT